MDLHLLRHRAPKYEACNIHILKSARLPHVSEILVLCREALEAGPEVDFHWVLSAFSGL